MRSAPRIFQQIPVPPEFFSRARVALTAAATASPSKAAKINMRAGHPGQSRKRLFNGVAQT
jgi:hypothetical protein